jgi:redox-sensitive bicupin YhaK (pirin superfamily)
VVRPGQLAYLEVGRGELVLSAADPTRVLRGGEPFTEPVLMRWYFAVRSRGELDRAYRRWESGDRGSAGSAPRWPASWPSRPFWARPTQPG